MEEEEGKKKKVVGNFVYLDMKTRIKTKRCTTTTTTTTRNIGLCSTAVLVMATTNFDES
jgi:hypothetical protein